MDASVGTADHRAGRITFRDVLAVRAVRTLWLAQVQSQIGDQLARIAVTVFVFAQTGSAAVTAIVYALTFVPAIVGGVVLGGLADRFPRRAVMVVCDLARAALVAVMAIPAVPLPVVCVLLVLVVFVGQPFLAAEAAILPSLLSGERYVVASGLRMLTSQLAQLAGFAAGGVVVAALGVRGSLALNAATFVISAVLIVTGVPRTEPSADEASGAGGSDGTGGSLRSAAALVWTDRRLFALAGLGWLAAFHVVPEGLAAPFAAEIGGGARSIGLLMAAPPAGTALGAYLILRVRPELRVRLIGPLALLSGVPLVLCGLHPGLLGATLLWAALGVLAAYQVPAAATFVRLVPPARRGQVFGLIGAAMTALQGFGIVVFGVLAEHLGAAHAIALAGVVAALMAGGFVTLLRRAPVRDVT